MASPVRNVVLATFLATLLHTVNAHATCDGLPNAAWSLKDTVSACPAGDSVLAGRASRLRITIHYMDSDCIPKVGVPPDSIWVTYTTTSTLKVNGKASEVYADDSTDASGNARITFPSFSGCGNLNVTLRISGTSLGQKTARIRTTDTDANGTVASADAVSPCDINWSGSSTQADIDLVSAHNTHLHRQAMHGTLVRRTNNCMTCTGPDSGAIGGSTVSWSPSGRFIAFSEYGGDNSCKISVVPADPANGNGVIHVTNEPGSHAYDPSWNPVTDELTFASWDDSLVARPLPWSSGSPRTIYKSPCGLVSPNVSPDGLWIAFSRCNPGLGGWSIWKTTEDGSILKQLTSDSLANTDFYPSWSPDGEWILFQRTVASGFHRIMRVPADSGTVEAVYVPSDSVDAIQPAYSADGLIVVAGAGKRSEVNYNVITNALNPSLAPLAPNQLIASYADTLFAAKSDFPILSPRISPDGTRIAIKARQIWASRRNMSRPPQITSITPSCGPAPTIVDSTFIVAVEASRGANNTYVFNATDPEGDALTYAVYFLDETMSFNAGTRTLTVATPQGAPQGAISYVRVLVTTANGGCDAMLVAIHAQSGCSSFRSADPMAARSGSLLVGPNPVGTQFSVLGDATSKAAIELFIFDLAGRRIVSLRGAGAKVTWDTRDQRGMLVPPGVYNYRVRQANYEEGGRIVVVR